MRISPSVAVVGAGFSGSLVALHLLKSGPPDLRILLAERGERFGRGLAYGAANPEHLLNVRVGNMSAFPDQPRHLEQWLRDQGCGPTSGPAAFITRETYGRYLGSLLAAAIGEPRDAGRLLLLPDEAVSLRRRAGGLRLELALGNAFDVDAAVLATGNPPPPPPACAGLAALPDGVYVGDPWSGAALADLPEDAPLLLLGSGLTMVDVMISLEARGHRGSALALSRRGLLPRGHATVWSDRASAPEATDAPLSQLVKRVRARAGEVGWRAAVDGLRPLAQTTWRRADLTERRRFLRHLRPWWDAHRHRTAPVVATRIEGMIGQGRLGVIAGRLLSAHWCGDRAVVTWRPRGGRETRTFHAARIINCTGPGVDAASLDDPLIRALLADGDVRPDPLGLGLEVDAESRIIAASGRVHPRLSAVGPLTRGAFWEIVAVPDIRVQAAEVARRLAATLSTQAALAI